MRYNKFHAKPTTLDGHRFASKAESRRYTTLKLMERAGEIKDLKLQPTFELQPAFQKDGIKYQAIKYVADFSYFDNHHKKTVIEDVKSPATKTPVYRLKQKMFEYKFASRTIKEVY